ncbi:hypothetical protein ACH3VR_22695 [Microbacterium sp. B2969]|uniref:Uncharacterized protein n=1 Tax=Microbacterium alkaliflavum TaxID=3248839 RepID=A0ABW7QG65_9MICO
MDTVRSFKELSKTRLKTLRSSGDTSLGLQQVQHRVATDAGYRSWSALLGADERDRQLALVMTPEPHLNIYGFGPGSFSKTLEQRREEFEQRRGELRASASHVDEVRAWLAANIAPRRTLNTQVGSYALKHLAEEDLGDYVANGELIAAAIIAGYPYRRGGDGSPNAVFGVRSRSITVLRQRLR